MPGAFHDKIGRSIVVVADCTGTIWCRTVIPSPPGATRASAQARGARALGPPFAVFHGIGAVVLANGCVTIVTSPCRLALAEVFVVFRWYALTVSSALFPLCVFLTQVCVFSVLAKWALVAIIAHAVRVMVHASREGQGTQPVIAATTSQGLPKMFAKLWVGI